MDILMSTPKSSGHTVKINLPIFKDISMYASVLGTIAQRYNQCNSQWSGLLSEMASPIILMHFKKYMFIF